MCVSITTLLSPGLQFPKTILIVIIILIWSSSQKHLFLFHWENINTQKKFLFLPSNLKCTLTWVPKLFSRVRANELFILFSKTSLHCYNHSHPLLLTQGLSSHNYTFSLLQRHQFFSLCYSIPKNRKHYFQCLKRSFPTKYFSGNQYILYRLHHVPQKNVCWSPPISQ